MRSKRNRYWSTIIERHRFFSSSFVLSQLARILRAFLLNGVMHRRLSGARSSRKSSQAITYFLRRVRTFLPSSALRWADSQVGIVCPRRVASITRVWKEIFESTRRSTKVEFFIGIPRTENNLPRIPARNCSLSPVGNINGQRGIASIDDLLARFLCNALFDTVLKFISEKR